MNETTTAEEAPSQEEGCPHCDNKDDEKMVGIAPAELDLEGPWAYRCADCGYYSFFARQGDRDVEVPQDIFTIAVMLQARDTQRAQVNALDRIANSLERREDKEDTQDDDRVTRLSIVCQTVVVLGVLALLYAMMKMVFE